MVYTSGQLCGHPKSYLFCTRAIQRSVFKGHFLAYHKKHLSECRDVCFMLKGLMLTVSNNTGNEIRMSIA